MSDHPELDKLAAISDKSQAIHDFLEWCNQTHGLWLAARDCLNDDHPDECGDDGEDCEMSTRLLPTHLTDRTLLAEFFDIDMNKVDDEQRGILRSYARAQEQRLIDKMRSPDA